MKYKISLFLLLLTALGFIIFNSFQLEEKKDFNYDNWYSAAMSNIEKSEYYIKYNDNKSLYSCPNRRNNLRFYFYNNGFRIENREKDEWFIEMNMLNYKKGDEEYKFSVIKEINDSNRLMQIGDGIIREYINKKEGLKDNYILTKKINRNEYLELNIEIKTNGNYIISRNGIGFKYNDKRILDYKGLKVIDAYGNKLNSWFEKTKKGYKIIVEDNNAKYPLTIDPITR